VAAGLAVWVEILRVGFGAIRAHKFRAALTVLSITIGAFSIVLMASLARSGVATISRGIEEVGGARMVVFFSKQPEKAERKQSSYLRGLITADLEALRDRVPHARFFDMHNTEGERDMRAGGTASKRADVVAGTQDFLGAFSIRLLAGRNLDASDLSGRRRVAVIGDGVRRALFPSAEAALGRIVRADTESYRVVGVADRVKRFGVNFGFDWNDFLLRPLTPVAEGQPHSGNLLVVTDGAESNDIVKRVAAAILQARHRGVDDFQVFDFSVVLERFYGVFRIMQFIVAFIAAIALVVGGIGVMNILLVSVSERVREIGIRKAMGAADGAIALQFVLESALLSGLGGLVGTACGVGGVAVAGMIIARKEEAWISVVSPQAVVGALVLSIGIGLLFGIMPARRAARLQVVDCLRASG
jgi:putative ABC transport system permease protein